MASKRTVTKSRAPVGGRRKPTRLAHDLDDFASGMGNETSDDNDVHIVFLEGGGALFVPQSLRNAPPGQYATARELQRVVIQRQRLMQDVSRLVAELRQGGVSWNAIGWCVGTTGEAARQRWGVHPEEPF